MKVTLLAHTIHPEEVVAAAGNGCYSTKSPEELHMKFLHCPEDTAHQIEIIHGSCFEHAVFTFGIEGLSHVCTHQLVRHRLASFSQQSQRYTKASIEGAYVPVSLTKADPAIEARYLACVSRAFEVYQAMIEAGIPKEDARYVLPSSVLSNITVTMNTRELRHFFGLRCCSRAQWEIRSLANQMLALCKDVAPNLFKDAGPQCRQLGYCPEHKPCGKAPVLDDLCRAWWRERMQKPKITDQEEKQ